MKKELEGLKTFVSSHPSIGEATSIEIMGEIARIQKKISSSEGGDSWRMRDE